ncbi:MAG: hypothetical protein ACTSPR_03305 [Candidatus Thorarchaeota archaeon]
MYFELSLIPFSLIVLLFLIFWIVQEGSSWQKHPQLGVFARFIQASAGRAFFTFLMLTILLVPTTLLLLQGVWWDLLATGDGIANTVPVVNTLLLMFLVLAGMIPVMWSSFRTWRHAVRAAAEVKVRTTVG